MCIDFEIRAITAAKLDAKRTTPKKTTANRHKSNRNIETFVWSSQNVITGDVGHSKR